MRRWIFALTLLIASMPSVLAEGRGHRHGRGHDKHYRQSYYRGHYDRRYVPRVQTQFYYRQGYGPAYAPVRRHWVPAYAPLPIAYRPRIAPVPAAYYESYGPVPYGCRRGMIDGYVVDYRPSNFLVVNFSRVW